MDLKCKIITLLNLHTVEPFKKRVRERQREIERDKEKRRYIFREIARERGRDRKREVENILTLSRIKTFFFTQSLHLLIQIVLNTSCIFMYNAIYIYLVYRAFNCMSPLRTLKLSNIGKIIEFGWMTINYCIKYTTFDCMSPCWTQFSFQEKNSSQDNTEVKQHW